MHFLYLVTRDDGEQYVGVSQYPFRRMKEHFSGNGSKALKGRSFIHDILQEGSETEIYLAEHEYIKAHKPSLNIAAGGHGGFCGISKKGEDCHFAKITENTVRDIRNYSYNNPKATQADIALMYGVARETVSNICTGRSWNHVAGPLQNRVKAKYSEADFIRAYQQNPSPSHLATTLNISRSTVYNLIKRLIILSDGRKNDTLHSRSSH